MNKCYAGHEREGLGLTQFIAKAVWPARLGLVLALPLRQGGPDEVQQHSRVLAAVEAECHASSPAAGAGQHS
jgi:hypothetical protein